MLAEISVIVILLAVAASAPVEHQNGATSFVALSLGGHSETNQQSYLALPQYQTTPQVALPQYQTSPVYIQKQTPAIIKVPTVAYKQQGEEYAPAQYEFNYSVEDKHTGDIKSQHEVRNGDEVKGEYSLHEADGTVRTVKYSADKHSGFNAIVERTGHATHPEVVPVKAVHQAPVVHQVVESGHGLGYYH